MTGLLVRGVDEGRVPEYCRVSSQYGRWRPLDSVREIAARIRPAAATGAAEAVRELVESRERIPDEEDLCHNVMRVTMLVTGAESGMFHLRNRS